MTSMSPWPSRVFPYVVGESDRMRHVYAVLTSVARGTDESMRAALGRTAPRLSLRELERLYVLETLEHTRWNRAKAARLLGISVRGLQYKLQRYLGESRTASGIRA
jgi:DNA-binding NtrC family response regulator